MGIPGFIELNEKTQEISFRHHRKGDEVLITRLFEEVFGDTMTVEQWRWKYEGQGFLNQKSFVATNEDGRIIGHFGGIPLRMWFKDKVIVGYQGADVMVDEKYRGLPNRRGLYSNICRLFYENLPSFVYGFSNLDHLRLGMLLGFFEKAIEVNDITIYTTKHVIPLYNLEMMDWEDSKIDTLWNEVYRSLGWSIVRNTAFLKWRYEHNPFRYYRLYGLRRRFIKGILGWVVMREVNDDEFWLMDMIFKDEHLEYLLKTIISMAYKQGKKKIVLWLSSRYHDRLRSMGGEFFRRGTYITNCIWVKMCESDEMREKFYYTMGDTDFL